MLEKLYRKSEIWYAIVWIIAYVVFASLGDNLSAEIGVLKIITLPILLVLSMVLFIFVVKNGLSVKYGLCKPQLPSNQMLYYIPLIVLLTANLWYGVALNTSILETILYILSMFCVGFLEEIIFRGFLFKMMEKDNVRTAIIVSSVTFGIGHIINLLNGADILPTLMQIVYATAAGYLFVTIFYKSKSLWPCIITHILVNSLSIFNGTENVISIWIAPAFLTIVSILYSVYINKIIK